MRPVICDVCGKTIRKSADLVTSAEEPFVAIDIISSVTNESEKLDVCIDCYGKLLNYAKNLQHQDEPK